MTISLTRRQLCLAATGLALAPASIALASEDDIELGSVDDYKEALASGEPFVLAILSSW